MKKIFSVFLICLASTACAQVKPVLLNSGGGVCEPSIMVDPSDPNRIVAGSVFWDVYTSADGGKKWTSSILTSTYGVWGDPVIIVDNKKNFYYFHLANPPASLGSYIDRIVCQKSTDGGFTWSKGTYAGKNGKKCQDKHWITVDRSNNTMYMSWTQFDAYDSRKPQDSSIILFSKSMDEGSTWSKPVRLSQYAGNCVDSDSTTEGAVPAIGINGELFVAWSMDQKIYMDRSTDGGATWLAKDIVVADQPGGWDYAIPGLYRCNGLPVTLTDTSTKSPHRGNLYVCWSDQKNGATDTDIWIACSRDAGNTWTSPIRINNSDGTAVQQFMCWPAIDPVTGNLYVVFYDRQGSKGIETYVTIASSTDGGNTWKNKRITKKTFSPFFEEFFGDYTNIVAHNNKVYPIWTEMRDKKTYVYTAVIDAKLLLK